MISKTKHTIRRSTSMFYGLFTKLVCSKQIEGTFTRTMDLCILCLENQSDSEPTIKVNSQQWKEWKIEEIIEKHVWPLKSLTPYSWLCKTCWQVLDDFHQFYKRIELAQNLLTSAILKTEAAEEENNYVNTKAHYTEKVTQHNYDEHENEVAIEQQFVKNKIENVKDLPRVELQPLDVKVEQYNSDTVGEEEIAVPIRRRSCRRFSCGGDPLKKPKAKTKKRSNRKVRKIETITKKKDGEQETKTKNTVESLDLKSNTNSENHEDNTNHSFYSDDYKVSLNFNYKPSAEHVEQDKFVAENFKIVCGICQSPMPTFYEVCAHSVQEHEQRGFVRCCNKKFYRRVILAEHIRWHLEPERFKCKTCGKVLADRRCLQVHERLHEQQERSHICDLCGKGFARSVTLQRHKYTHIPDDEKKIPCQQCDKRFVNNELLTEHVRSVHLRSYSVVCDICGKEIRSKAVFNRHMLQHAGLQTTVSCDICGLKLSDKRRLKVHKQTQHTEEARKEFKCHICSKVSASISALKQHVQYNHETGYDFKCTVCDKAFKRACTLKEHMATHTGTVLYTCSYCPKTFNSNANMYTHRKKAHPQKWEAAFREKYSGNLPPKLQKTLGVGTIESSRSLNESV